MKSGRNSLLLYLFLLPALAVYGTFVLYPFLNSFYLSLHKWDGLGDLEWIGLDNYYSTSDRSHVLTDLVLGRALLNNVKYWLITLVSEVVTGLVFASLLVRTRRGETFYRLALSLPLMIALIASGILWRQLLADRGLINSVLGAIGLNSLRRTWLDPQYVVYTVSIISGWAYSGFYMLIFYAALQRIPKELREAAAIDGASEWSVFSKIELPLLRPVIAVCVLLCSTGAFRAFDLFYVILGSGMSSRTEVASTWLVKNAFTFKFFGYASAIGVVVVFVVMTVTLFLNLWASREREREVEF